VSVYHLTSPFQNVKEALRLVKSVDFCWDQNNRWSANKENSYLQSVVKHCTKLEKIGVSYCEIGIENADISPVDLIVELIWKSPHLKSFDWVFN